MINTCIYQVLNTCIYQVLNTCIYQVLNTCIHQVFNTCIYQVLNTCIYQVFNTCIHQVFNTCIYQVCNTCIYQVFMFQKVRYDCVCRIRAKVKTKLLICHRNRGSSNISTNSFIIIIKTLFNEDAYLTIVNLP